MNLNLKMLKEQRADILNSMREMTETIEIFDSVKFEAMKNELESVENSIKEFDNAQQIKNTMKKESDKMEFKNELMSGKEIDLSQVKNEAHQTENTAELIKDDYATQIERKLREKCVLYDRARKIVTASPHIIPVEKVTLGKFVKVAELGEYVKDRAEFGSVKLGAIKFGTMVQVSEELLADNDFQLEAILMAQLQDAFADTVCELIAKGDEEGIEGLAMADEAKGAKKVVVADIDDDAVLDLMFALDRQYREDAIFVINDEVARKLAKLKDEMGRPLLQLHADEAVKLAEGVDGKLKGKDVVICNELPAEKPAFFVDMKRALVVGLRKNMTIKKSEEAGFMNDSIFIKANVRLDMKILLHEAIAFIEIA